VLVSVIVLIAAATFLLNVSSCGFNQHLVSINIPEPSGTFGGNWSGGFFLTSLPSEPTFTLRKPRLTDIVTWQSDKSAGRTGEQ